MALSGLALTLNSAPALAAGQAPAKRILSIRAGLLSDALTSLAIQTGVSIGLPGNIPVRRVPALNGSMSIEGALQRLLRGSGFKAIQTGPMAWRLVPHKAIGPAPTKPRAEPEPPAVPAPPAPDIVVTASKNSSSLQTMPVSVQVVTDRDLQRVGAVPGTSAVAALADGMALSNLGPGRNRAFLRGVADSPFNGVTQSTVAIEVDDARVTFNAPDPELRLIDIKQIELLEGPQGPLHGTGALGGVYRILPNAARTDRHEAAVALGAEVTRHGGAGQSGSAMLNIPLARDRIGLRLVGYGAREPGWIDRAGADGTNSNSSRVMGGRASLRWLPADDWSIDLSGIIQMLHVADSQYADVPGLRYARGGSLAEPHDNDFINGRLTIKGRIGDADLISATGWTLHEVDSSFDASLGAAKFGVSAPALFVDGRNYAVRNQEIRLSGGSHIRWMAGLSYIWASMQLHAAIKPEAGADVAVGQLHQVNAEQAVFGELFVPLLRDIRLDVGARLFRATVDNELDSSGATLKRLTRRTGLSPSASLSWSPDQRRLIYLRLASAYRPSGLSPFVPPAEAEFKSDELQSVELGARFADAQGNLHLGAAAYLANWSHIQSDYVLANGLIATRNSGAGQIYGLETRIQRAFGPFGLEGGLVIQHARLEKPEPGLVLPADSRLPIVPGLKGHLIARYAIPVRSGGFELAGQFNYSGYARLSLDPALNKRIAPRATVDVDLRRSWGNWSLSAGGYNLLDSGRNSFGFGNPFSVFAARQSTPLKPRTLYLRLSRGF